MRVNVTGRHRAEGQHDRTAQSCVIVTRWHRVDRHHNTAAQSWFTVDITAQS